LTQTNGSSTNKLSVSTYGITNNKDAVKTESPRSFSSTKRFGGDTSSHGRSNPFNSLGAGSNAALASPGAGGSPAFGLGSGVFASFGASKGAKTPGATTEPSGVFGQEKELSNRPEKPQKEDQSLSTKTSNSNLLAKSSSSDRQLASKEHQTKSSWVIWYRPPTSKNADYEKSITALASFSTIESFWAVYSHLKRPSTLPTVSDYHIFKKGIRPVWEDEENKSGGKFIVRLKKGVADRYWELLLMAIVGNQFGEAGEEVNGAVLSVRSGEDVLSVWTKLDGGRNIRIRYDLSPNSSLPNKDIERP
jgi:translation initiation factor 4E